MSRYTLSRQAESDLDSIYDYILDSSGPVVALRLHDEFVAAFDTLAAHPNLGHRHPDIADPNLRCWTLHSYLIVYWNGADPISIARVIHGARDISQIDIDLT